MNEEGREKEWNRERRREKGEEEITRKRWRDSLERVCKKGGLKAKRER